MIWDGISHVERTDLKVIDGNLNAARYRDEIIAPIVLPFLCNLFRTVWSEIRTLVLPGVSLAVCTAVTKRLRR
jgi:hypothetical protein